jgi:hypothetical protein
VALVGEQTFKTDPTGLITIPVTLKAGIYRATVATQDRFGKPVTARQTIQVVDRGQSLRRADCNHLARRGGPSNRAVVPLRARVTTPAGLCRDRVRGQVLRAGGPTRPDQEIILSRSPSPCGGFTLRVLRAREPSLPERADCGRALDQ